MQNFKEWLNENILNEDALAVVKKDVPEGSVLKAHSNDLKDFFKVRIEKYSPKEVTVTRLDKNQKEVCKLEIKKIVDGIEAFAKGKDFEIMLNSEMLE